MAAATAAILPSRIATSRTALILFFPSTTWPPFSSRSYSCASADELSNTVRLSQNCVFIAQLFYTSAVLLEFPGVRNDAAQTSVPWLPPQRPLQFTGVR